MPAPAQPGQTLLYPIYKPLKNKLERVNVDESLFVVWNYISELHGTRPAFNGIEVFPGYLQQGRESKVQPWELEMLTREIIVNSGYGIYDAKSLRQWSFIASCFNQIKSIGNELSRSFVDQSNILLELHRVAHQQFPWQMRTPNKEFFTRYYKIFSDPGLAALVNNAVGLSVPDFYLVATSLWGFFVDKVALDYPPRIINIPGVDHQKLNLFLKHFSLDLQSYISQIKASRDFNEKFTYTPKVGRYFPIIRMTYFGKPSLVCLDSTLFFWRVTDGLYYEIYKLDGFSDSFGPSFQRYIGEVLEKVCSRLTFHGEVSYGTAQNRRDSVDWIVDNVDCALFIECKTKRMQERSKIELFDLSFLNADLGKMADFVVQTYKNIKEYRESKYPHFHFDPRKKVFPLVVTLENWLLMGRPLEMLHAIVKEKMEASGLPLEWLEDMPFGICATEELEDLIQICEQVGICEVMGGKLFNAEKKLWTFDSYFLNVYRDIPKRFLFEEDYNQILPIQLGAEE